MHYYKSIYNILTINISGMRIATNNKYAMVEGDYLRILKEGCLLYAPKN